MEEFKILKFRKKYKEDCIKEIKINKMDSKYITNFKNEDIVKFNNIIESLEKNNDNDQEGNFKDIENPKENNSINNIITKKELTEKNLKDNKLENLEEPNKSKINKFMLIYDMKTVLTDNSIKWPVNLIYGTKKYYLMNKKKDIVNINHNILN